MSESTQKNATHATGAGGHELLIERSFDAPCSLVFEVWSHPEHIAQWWGPKDFTVPMCQMDFRVGGRYRARIVSPEGQEYVMRGEYREIAAPTRLVFTFAWEETGERGMETLITVNLTQRDGKTHLRFHQAPFQSSGEHDGHGVGWNQAFDRLDALLLRLH